MGLTEEQTTAVFELLKLASPEQRERFLANLRFLGFNDRQESCQVDYRTTGTTRPWEDVALYTSGNRGVLGEAS